MTADKLGGSCHECVYGRKCLGGCPNTRLTMNGTIYSENQYCAYNLGLKNMETKYSEISNANGLFQMAEDLIRQGEYQEAAFALEQVIKLQPENMQAYKAKGYAEYRCGNYLSCKEDNMKVLEQNSNDAYALKGYEIACCHLGDKEDVIRSIKRQ